MSVLVLAGVEVVSDDKVDENVMVEANLVVDKVVVAKVVMHEVDEVDEVGVVLVWSHPHPHQDLKKEIINHSDVKMCSKIIRKIIATFLKNILHSCKNR